MFICSRKSNHHKNPQFHIEQQTKPVNHLVRIATAFVLCATIAGCSVSSGVESVALDDTIVTNSVTKTVEPEGIKTADAEIIKTTVADAKNTNALAWQNPDTGNKGTITAIDRFTGSHGQKCKKFQTTVDTFMGISLYNGETCELKKGFWVLSWLLKEAG